MQSSSSAFAGLDKVRTERLRALETELGFRIRALDPGPQLAELSLEHYARVQALEKELGITLVAFGSISQIRLAQPSKQQLQRLSGVEKELGFILVAYELAGEDVRTPRASDAEKARLAKLSDQQYEKLHKVEEEVGLTLMAYSE
ncbi:MAG TPA: hypothetical protein VGH73_23940 [Thermoanaerobaculia bacterium]